MGKRGRNSDFFKKGDLVQIIAEYNETQQTWIACDPRSGIVLASRRNFIDVLVDGEITLVLPSDLRLISKCNDEH